MKPRPRLGGLAGREQFDLPLICALHPHACVCRTARSIELGQIIPYVRCTNGQLVRRVLLLRPWVG